MSHRLLLAAAICLLAFGARGADQTIQFHTDLDGADEVPANKTAGTGNFGATLDRDTKVLTYSVTYQGLTGPVVAGHFHGPAEPRQNANIVVPLQPPLASPIKGKATLTDQQVQQLMANNWYVNLHTKAYPNGEIRGQVLHGGP